MEIPKSFLGYKRENGRVGTRNHVVILPVDDISNACAEAVANNIKGTFAIPHAYGRLQFGADLELFFDTMIGTGKNPNVAAVIVIGIEPKWTKRIVDEVAKTPRHLLSLEVMDLLERQAPETASTVRGLTRWSVQSRLEHQLAETVQHVVIDLEGLLDEYERSVTMLAQMQEVLRGLVDLGLPAEDVKPLERFSHMPEALPYISVEARRLIQRSLDEIYLDADRRTAGDAVGLAETVEVLESLLRRLDVAGLTGEEPTCLLYTSPSPRD